MCLFVDLTRTKNWRRKKTGEMTVYKVLFVKRRFNGYYLTSPFYGQEYKTGYNLSDRNYTKLYGTETKRVKYGIHVFLKEEDAKKLADKRNYVVYTYNNSQKPIAVVVKLKVYRKDFVAINSRESTAEQAVFTKVFLSKSEYNKVIKESKNNVIK